MNTKLFGEKMTATIPLSTLYPTNDFVVIKKNGKVVLIDTESWDDEEYNSVEELGEYIGPLDDRLGPRTRASNELTAIVRKYYPDAVEVHVLEH